MNGKKHLLITWAVATAVVGVVHALVPGGWGGIFLALGRMVAGRGSWADSLIAVPVWLVCILWSLILTAVGAVLLLIVSRRRRLEVEIPTITKADILGLRWRWHYQEDAICDLQSYCPKCDRPVNPRNEKRHGFLQLISYQCDCRKWRSKSFQCSEEQLFDQVCRAIQEQNANRSGRRPGAGARRVEPSGT